MCYEFLYLQLDIVLEQSFCPGEVLHLHVGGGIIIYLMSGISRECSLYLSVQNQLQFLHYQTLSGLGFNKLGLYQQCIADPANQFYLLQGNYNFFNTQDATPDLWFMSGLCFNRICSASDLEYALAAMQEYIPNRPFQQLHIETPSLIEKNIDITTVIVLGIISVLLLLFFICSVIDIVRKKRNRRDQTQLVEIFSVLTVIRLLENKSQRNNQRVKTFSGVKALSLGGIALTNLGTIAYFAPTTSFYEQTQDESIYACFYGVDIWLMASGFFLSYLLLKQYQKLQDKRVLLLKILRRFLRLWPIYLICLFLNWNVLPLVGSGPIWPLLIDFPQQFCSTYVPHLFMLSNLTTESCYNALWLLELDFQLCFIFVPLLLLYINASHSKLSKYCFYLLQIGFLGAALGAGLAVNESKVRSLTHYFFLTQYYGWNTKPFVRCGGFLLGYNLGIIYYNFKKGHHKQRFWVIKLLKNKVFRVGVPTGGVLGLLGVAISFHNLNNVALSPSYFLYFAALRTLVPLLVIMMILPSLFGYCSALKSFFQSRVCNLVSKLSLSVFGMHYIISLYLIYYRQSDLEMSNFTIIFLAFCTILPAVLLAIILTSIIEIPVFVLKKIYSKTERITYFEH